MNFLRGLKIKLLGGSGCENGFHRWHNYRKQTDKFVYYLRECRACGLHQIQNNGNLGNCSWRDIHSPFRWDWERDDFENAKFVKKITTVL